MVITWPFFGLFVFFFLAKSQTDESPQDVGFAQHETRDCSKTGQGCKGFDEDKMSNPRLQSIMQPLSSKDSMVKVVLEVKDLEASDLETAPPIREPSKGKPECHGDVQDGVQIDLVHIDSDNKGDVKDDAKVGGLRLLLFCMLVSFASLFVVRCRMSLVLLLLGCWMTDQIVQWGSLVRCSKPIHTWLLVSYATACAVRLAFQAADKYLGSDADVPWYLRHSMKWGFFPRACMAVWVLVPLPFMMYWSILGISWLNHVIETSSLYDSDSHAQVTAVVACLIFNLLGVVAGLIFVLYACLVSRSFVIAGEALNAISDADLIERWGTPQPMLEEDLGSGMDPAEIANLPCAEVPADKEASNCAICLTGFVRHDRIRQLPACKHEFHRACIDQWLLRMASCPLCLAPVTGHISCSPCASSVSCSSVARSLTNKATAQAADDVV
eukprot:gnl/MRDRNA2_/MRDRNA2_95587_c0_seq1.p1 gnl/MRDRNA2_/MRDRNA2_95587_c0~~gnl/MRDRNA2_/MRDRNA2_95587_c0_seq1.p1  ORF type:complete len:440 (+),score=47.56 gnl/MRDRNA2_/MRDRNA2_95587_c0_seq1:122-1441(+)